MRHTLFALLLSAVLALTACGGSQKQQIGSELGLDLSQAAIVQSEDSHSGFLGDGSTRVVLSLPEGEAVEAIRSNWTPFPLDQTAETLLYGISPGEYPDGPYLTREDGTPMVPEIRNGFYLLLDRQETQEVPLLERYSFNFTLAVYDADSGYLYYCQLDT